jgi:hypothetical protein
MPTFVLAVLVGAVVLQRATEPSLPPSAAALSEQVLGTIRGSDPNTGQYQEDCSWYNYGYPNQVPWDECLGQPDGTTTCVKCVDGKFNGPDYTPGASGWVYTGGFNCGNYVKMERTCIAGVCQGQMQMGNCSGTRMKFSGQ